jgi:hypothetical protein
MDYKGRFLPQQRLAPSGWLRIDASGEMLSEPQDGAAIHRLSFMRRRIPAISDTTSRHLQVCIRKPVIGILDRIPSTCSIGS